MTELNLQIREGLADPDSLAASALEAKRLQAKRGEPFVYRTIEKRGRLALDLGFRDSHPLPESVASELIPGQLVRSVPDGRLAGGYLVEEARLRARLYAFPATVERIIDGDTLWATIDLGFDIWADRKLRLRGIDTPERKTAGGTRATDYLTMVLAEAEPFVVTTTKVDLYDRYLADLFVLPGEGVGLAMKRTSPQPPPPAMMHPGQALNSPVLCRLLLTPRRLCRRAN